MWATSMTNWKADMGCDGCGRAPCACALQQGTGVTITGTGIPSDPWVISATGGGGGALVTPGYGVNVTGDGSEGDPYVVSAYPDDTDVWTWVADAGSNPRLLSTAIGGLFPTDSNGTWSHETGGPSHVEVVGADGSQIFHTPGLYLIGLTVALSGERTDGGDVDPIWIFGASYAPPLTSQPLGASASAMVRTTGAGATDSGMVSGRLLADGPWGNQVQIVSDLFPIDFVGTDVEWSAGVLVRLSFQLLRRDGPDV